MAQRCLCLLCCQSLLQGEFLLCRSQRGRGVEVKSLPKKAGGIPGRISVSSRERRAEALGLRNVLFHPRPQPCLCWYRPPLHQLPPPR